MSSTAPLDDAELAAWHGMLRTHALVIRSLDEQLARHHGLAVSEFDVLITLASAPDRELRMSELADRVMLSPSGFTRLVGRLERIGLSAGGRPTTMVAAISAASLTRGWPGSTKPGRRTTR